MRTGLACQLRRSSVAPKLPTCIRHRSPVSVSPDWLRTFSGAAAMADAISDCANVVASDWRWACLVLYRIKEKDPSRTVRDIPNMPSATSTSRRVKPLSDEFVASWWLAREFEVTARCESAVTNWLPQAYHRKLDLWGHSYRYQNLHVRQELGNYRCAPMDP